MPSKDLTDVTLVSEDEGCLFKILMKVFYWQNVVYWWKLSFDESCLLMKVANWWKLSNEEKMSNDKKCLRLKVAGLPRFTGYPGDLKFPGRCDSFYTNFTPIFLQFGDHLKIKIWHLVSQMDNLFVCDQGGGPPAWQWPWHLKGAGEEVNCPAGGARGGWRSCGGEVSNFTKNKNFNSNTLAFSECEGRLARSHGLGIYSHECWNQNFWIGDLQLVTFHFRFL